MEETEKRQIPRSAAGDSADGSQPPRYRSYMSSPFIVAALPLRREGLLPPRIARLDGILRPEKPQQKFIVIVPAQTGASRVGTV